MTQEKDLPRMQEASPTGSSRSLIIWLACALIGAAATFGIIIWGIPRGFDRSDEAWVYSLISSNRVAVGEAWGFQHVLHPLFVVTGQSVLVFRVLRLLGYFLVSCFLILVAHKIASAARIRLAMVQWLFIFAVSQIGTFLAWSFPPRDLGYNEISSWLTQVGAGLLILVVSSRLTGAVVVTTRWLWALWAGLGFIVTMLLMVKITSGILFGLLALSGVFLSSAQLSRARRALAAAGGVVIGLLILFVTGFPFVPYLSNLLSLVFNTSARAAYGHPLESVGKGYVLALGDTFQVLLPSLILFIALVGGMSILLVPGVSEQIRGIIRAIVAFTAFLEAVSLFLWPAVGITFTYLGYMCIFIGASGLISFALWLALSIRANISETSSRRRTLVLVFGALVVVATPFVGAVGTNNAITGQLLYSATIWIVSLALLLTIVGFRLATNGSPIAASIPPVLLLCLMALSAIAVRGDAVDHPYNSAPYAQQTSPTTAHYLRGMLVTPSDAEWTNWLGRESVALHASGVPTIALSSPGALLAFNNSGFASPWVETFWPVSFNSIAAACSAQKPTDLFILQPATVELKSDVSKLTIAALHSCGIEFPSDFTVVAHHPSSDKGDRMNIWRLTAVG